MSTSHLELKELGRVKLFRRKGLKNIRISISSAGEIRLSIPWYVPKAAGIRYLYSKKSWIKENQKNINTEWKDQHKLTINYSLKIHHHDSKRTASKTEQKYLHVYVPTHHSEEKKQYVIDKQVRKFLQKQAEVSLIPQISRLAEKSGYSFKDIRVRRLKSRWGSCNHEKVITLNLALLKLPGELVEYVLFHELVHTKYMNHSKQFWKELEARVPEYKRHKKDLKTYNSAGIF